MSFVLEWGEEFQPPYSEMKKIILEITSGLLAFCLEVQNKLKQSSFVAERSMPSQK